MSTVVLPLRVVFSGFFGLEGCAVVGEFATVDLHVELWVELRVEFRVELRVELQVE